MKSTLTLKTFYSTIEFRFVSSWAALNSTFTDSALIVSGVNDFIVNSKTTVSVIESGSLIGSISTVK